LLWQVLWQSPDDTHFFVQLLDEEEQVLGQQDGDGYPAIHRLKGDRILSKFDIITSQKLVSGLYWLRMGQYLFPGIVNLPVIDETGSPVGDSVPLGPVGGGP